MNYSSNILIKQCNQKCKQTKTNNYEVALQYNIEYFILEPSGRIERPSQDYKSCVITFILRRQNFSVTGKESIVFTYRLPY